MKLRDLVLISSLLFSMASLAQEPLDLINIKITDEAFKSLVEQVETQTALTIYYRAEWFEGRSFTYKADSVPVDDARPWLPEATAVLRRHRFEEVINLVVHVKCSEKIFLAFNLGLDEVVTVGCGWNLNLG